ncbi:hypothetical protein PIB30_070493 [Stylosanthes scabra]|uniref:Uncharacterized protein n=1 Tax=Stylosanthes scabra TaxID=79078 RepID=A0ABU6RNN4_9FABA|nr:hypothetical protein [Stylosanthes scabra]
MNTQIGSYDLCGNQGHTSDTCALIFDQTSTTDQVNYMGNGSRQSNFDPHSKTYNPGWRHHPNFGLGGQGNQFKQENCNTPKPINQVANMLDQFRSATDRQTRLTILQDMQRKTRTSEKARHSKFHRYFANFPSLNLYLKSLIDIRSENPQPMDSQYG